jgi:hypothetical protein
MTWSWTGLEQTGAMANLRRGNRNISVEFPGTGLADILPRLFGAPSPSIFEVVDINSRYMAIEGSGLASYRFVDKNTGVVLPYAVSENSNNLTDLFVGRDGTPYIELVRSCRDLSPPASCIGYPANPARSSNEGRNAYGIRILQFDGKSLKAPLSEAQLAVSDRAQALQK